MAEWANAEKLCDVQCAPRPLAKIRQENVATVR